MGENLYRCHRFLESLGCFELSFTCTNKLQSVPWNGPQQHCLFLMYRLGSDQIESIYQPASMLPDQRLTSFSTITSNISSSFRGLWLITMALLNSQRGLIRTALRQLWLTATWPPWKGLNLKQLLSSFIDGARSWIGVNEDDDSVGCCSGVVIVASETAKINFPNEIKHWSGPCCTASR